MSEAATPATTISTPAAVAPSEGAPGVPGLTDTSTPADVLRALGAGDADGGMFDSEDADAAPAAEKKPAEGGKAKDGQAAPQGEDADVAEVQGILARSRERRQAKARAQAGRQAPAPAAAAPVKPPEAAPAAPAPAAAPLTASEKQVGDHVKDVLQMIAKLAGEDEAASTAAADGKAPETSQAQRNADLAAIKDKVDALAEGLKGQETGLKKTVEELQAKLTAFEEDRKVVHIIDEHIDANADKAPLVSSGKRFEVMIGERKVRGTGPQLVKAAAERFWDKFHVAPALPELIKRIEKKLAASQGPERSGTREAPPTRKTVSSSLGSPPSARTGPDTRSRAEIERDLYAKFGVESDDEFA